MTPKTLLLTALLTALPASAADVWSTPYPGIRMLQRTTSRPIVFWALVVDTCAPGIRLRATAPSEGTRRTSSFGRLVGAQMAINGDFADHDFGLNVGNGVRWSTPDTTHSGNFSVGPNRVEMTPDDVLLAAPAPWVTEQLGGRWTLLANGVPRFGIDDNGPTAGGFVCAPGLRHPRTAIGLSQDKRKVFIIVADGRSSASVGMTCDELIGVFQELGAHDAMGLDGGGSSTLWQSDRLVNHPSDSTGERTVRNHLAIFASGSGPAPHCVPLPEPAQAAPVPGVVLPAVQALTPPLRFTPVTPRRLFDTRTATSSALLVRSDGASTWPLTPTRSGAFSDWPAVGLGADVRAAWLNLAAVAPQAPGFLTVFPGGEPAPATSNLNFEPGRVAASAALVALGAGGRFDVSVSTSVDVLADVSGVLSPTAGAGLVPVTPLRVLDTRAPATRLLAGVTRAVDVRAPSDATAIAATVTVVAPAAAGFLTASACGAPVPATSSLNFSAGAVVSNAVASGLGNGQLCLTSTADTDVVVDVTGAFVPSAPLGYVPLTPRRLLDTRGTATAYTGRLAAGQVLQLPVQALPGMPPNVGAVVASVAVIDQAAAGFVTAFPCAGTPPLASTVNFPGEGVVSGVAMTGLGQGALCVTSSARVHLVVDLVGVWAVSPVAPADAGIFVDAGVGLDAGQGPPVMDAGLPLAPPDAGVGPADPGVDGGGGPVDEDAGGSASPEPPLDGAVTPGGDVEPVLGVGCAAAPGGFGLGLVLAFTLARRARARTGRNLKWPSSARGELLRLQRRPQLHYRWAAVGVIRRP